VTTVPLLSNVRHRAMITPVSPPLTRLIHSRTNIQSKRASVLRYKS